MVRDARDVCGSRVRRAGREEQRGDEPQRGWRTLGARTDITRVFTPSFFLRLYYILLGPFRSYLYLISNTARDTSKLNLSSLV
jgi:hypothetical protein